MMTVVAIMAGLLPILWGTGTGSEVMSHRCTDGWRDDFLDRAGTLAVIPAIYGLVKQFELRRRRA